MCVYSGDYISFIVRDQRVAHVVCWFLHSRFFDMYKNRKRLHHSSKKGKKERKGFFRFRYAYDSERVSGFKASGN